MPTIKIPQGYVAAFGTRCTTPVLTSRNYYVNGQKLKGVYDFAQD